MCVRYRKISQAGIKFFTLRFQLQLSALFSPRLTKDLYFFEKASPLAVVEGRRGVAFCTWCLLPSPPTSPPPMMPLLSALPIRLSVATHCLVKKTFWVMAGGASSEKNGIPSESWRLRGEKRAGIPTVQEVNKYRKQGQFEQQLSCSFSCEQETTRNLMCHSLHWAHKPFSVATWDFLSRSQVQFRSW